MNAKKLLFLGLLGAMVLAAAPALAADRSANFKQGDRVMAVTTINVRASANGALAGKQYAGAKGTLVSAPIVTGGYTWWKVDYDTGVDGWSAEDFLQSPSVALVQPGTGLAASVAYASAASKIGIGSSVVATDNLNARSTPGGTLVQTMSKGATGSVVGGPETSGGYTWWQVKYSTGTTGWSVSTYLSLAQ